jgi:hypothetical protein
MQFERLIEVACGRYRADELHSRLRLRGCSESARVLDSCAAAACTTTQRVLEHVFWTGVADAWSTRALLPRIALNVADAVKTTGVAYIQHGSHSGQATKGAGHAVLQLRVYQYQYQYQYKLRIIIRSREQVSFTGGAQCITSGIARVLRTVSLPSPPMRSMLTACDIGCCSSEVM